MALLTATACFSAVPASARAVSRATVSPPAAAGALRSVREMLKSNASVNYAHPHSVSAALAYETYPATRTQAVIDHFDLRNKVVAHLLSMAVVPRPIWQASGVYVLHATLFFREALTAKKQMLAHVEWNYEFVVKRQRNQSWKVADVFAYASIRHYASGGRFDFAPNVNYAVLAPRFLQGLNRYERTVHYQAGKVRLDPFGYYYDSKLRNVRLYLFVHNGTSVPIYNVLGSIMAKARGTEMFATPLALNPSEFGVLRPGKTRFCIVHIPYKEIHNVKLVESYLKSASVIAKFAYASV